MLDNVFNEKCLIAKDGQWKQNDKGCWYEYADGSYPISQWFEVYGDWYYADAKRYCYQNRWLQYKDKWYYFKDNCKMAHDETLSYSFNDKGEFIE